MLKTIPMVAIVSETAFLSTHAIHCGTFTSAVIVVAPVPRATLLVLVVAIVLGAMRLLFAIPMIADVVGTAVPPISTGVLRTGAPKHIKLRGFFLNTGGHILFGDLNFCGAYTYEKEDQST